MDAVFMNSKNSKTSDPHRLLLNLTQFKNQPQHRISKNLKYLMDHILHQMLKIILSIS